MNPESKTQSSIRFTHLEPLDCHSCNHCSHLYLDIGTGYFCPMHRGVDFRDKMKVVTINNCPDFITEGNAMTR